ASRPADTGTVDDDAQRRAGLDDLRDGGGNLVVAGDIGRDQGDACGHVVTGALDRRGHIQAENGGAQLGETLGGGGAEAACAAGDDGGGTRNLHDGPLV